MSTTEAVVQEARQQVLDALRSGERFVLVTHEHPDGDALGSLVGMHGLLTALGKDSVMFVCADEFPLPYEYRWFDLEGVRSKVPDDIEERTIVFLDCGTIERNPVEAFRRPSGLHAQHRPPPRQHAVRRRQPRREGRLVHRRDRLGPRARARRAAHARPTAEALYVGLITDTGRFMYENTGPRAHLMAADLIAAGIDHTAIYRRVYEELARAQAAAVRPRAVAAPSGTSAAP